MINQLSPAGPDDRDFEAQASARYQEGGGPLKERRLLNAIKRICRECGFENPGQYCLHTFRHAFASMCAMSNTSQKYALTWMGHRSSDVLDMYIEMYDSVAEEAIAGLDYEKASAKDSDGEQSGRAKSANKNRNAERRKRRSKSRADKPARRWKVSSKKRGTGDSV